MKLRALILITLMSLSVSALASEKCDVMQGPATQDTRHSDETCENSSNAYAVMLVGISENGNIVRQNVDNTCYRDYDSAHEAMKKYKQDGLCPSN